jgi:type II secretory ATPase GspE/PulE/Tfp pilus assembly ATPase PilB-like protein
VSRIIAAALDRDASDIHLEPVANGMRVRFRVNGVLVEWGEAVPPQVAKGIVARIKVVGGLDITERRRPQDGRIGLRAGRRDFDLRVSCLPSSRGEKVVMRVLDAAVGTRPLGNVFTEPKVLGLARKALNRPYGGIIIAGATGAGKTSTLYSMLNERRVTRPDTHIVMVEDPIEYRLEGVTQVQVDHGANLGFAQVLRSMLRQDPDVIVVGEMRDTETARIGLEAAMTGHVLLTSLHANNALAAVQRLEQLGCGLPLIAQSLTLVIVQRLVRRLCTACHTTAEAPQPLVDSLVMRKVLQAGASRMLPVPKGCDACNKTGYVGRIAVFEALHFNDDVRHLLAAGANFAEVEKAAVESGALVAFHNYAAQLIKEGLISGTEALLTVAD